MYRNFKPGDFIRMTYLNQGAFAIFQGKEVIGQYGYPTYTTLVYYNPSKYQEVEGKWVARPYLSVAREGSRFFDTVTVKCEGPSFEICTDKEKAEAIELLKAYGYGWDDEQKMLFYLQSGEIINKIVVPVVKYDGTEIAPNNEERLQCISAIIKKKRPIVGRGTMYGAQQGAPMYGRNFYDDEDYD